MKHFKIFLKFSFFAIIGFALFSSCSQKYSEEISRVDSLQLSLDVIDAKLYELDSNQVYVLYNKYTDTWARLSKVFPDVRDENWGTLCAFENIKSGIKGFKKHYSKLTKELEKSKIQLNSLKEDLKNENIEIEKFEEFYNSEVQAIFQLGLVTNLTIDNAKEGIVRFDSLSPIMEKVILQYQELQN